MSAADDTPEGVDGDQATDIDHVTDADSVEEVGETAASAGLDEEAAGDAEISPDAEEDAATIVETAHEDEAPLIAIVGRPNVGKSRLFNRLTGTRFAIVDDIPGVTRDRQYGEGEWYGHRFQIVDTGGFDPESPDELLGMMREQAQLAIQEASIVFVVVDAQSGVLPADREIASLLHKIDKPVFLLVNKVDGPKHDALAMEFYELGLSPLYPVSAEHGRGIDEMMDGVLPLLPRRDGEPRHDDDLRRVAVVGRPNAGKSTLINQLLGEERVLTSDLPGTTRDAINTYLENETGRFLFIDTAGIRRKRSISERVEKFSVVQAFKALDRADVAIIVLDATEGVSNQDLRIAGLADKKGRACIILLNKWDAIERDPDTARRYIEEVNLRMRFNTYAPIITVSALTGLRAHKIFPLIDDVFQQYIRRIGTGELNRFLDGLVHRNPPKMHGNKPLKIFYATQVSTRPPTFMFVVNDPRLVHFSYERFLKNAIRDEWGFVGTPIKVFFRQRGKKEDERYLGH